MDLNIPTYFKQSQKHIGTYFANISFIDLNILEFQTFDFRTWQKHNHAHWILIWVGPKQSSISIGLKENGKYDCEILINL